MAHTFAWLFLVGCLSLTILWAYGTIGVLVSDRRLKATLENEHGM
jgi:hypothetical protein